MKNIILFDDQEWQSLLPLTYTRPVAELRVGILTIREKWELYLGGNTSFITQDYLADKYDILVKDDNYIINGAVLPSPKLVAMISQIEPHEAILDGDELIAARLDRERFDLLVNEEPIEEMVGIDISNEEGLYSRIARPNDIFSLNDQEIRLDFDLLTRNRKSQKISDTNQVINPENIFIEPGAKVECAILNASTGPIYIGKDAEIMEGSIVRGPLAMCENSQLKLGAKIYGATTLGPYCKVGGEVNNTVFQAYSSKGHDGFIGNSVIGEWCNLGADTNCSNLKNNYEEVKLWDYTKESFQKTGLQFCGLIMGDHSKCGINTMFNTGTVVGVSTNIYGSGFPRNFVPSFSWGGASGFTTYRLPKVFNVAEKVMARRSKKLTEQDQNILNHIFLKTSVFRSWEK